MTSPAAYAEHVTIFHLMGMPASTVRQAHGLVHHTLGNGGLICSTR
jgi:indolepyruvate decarboxylase